MDREKNKPFSFNFSTELKNKACEGWIQQY